MWDADFLEKFSPGHKAQQVIKALRAALRVQHGLMGPLLFSNIDQAVKYLTAKVGSAQHPGHGHASDADLTRSARQQRARRPRWGAFGV